MLNKYAKQKKRRRNFSIDRRHHYDKILDETNEKKGSGWMKQIALVGFLSAMIFLAFQVKNKIKDGPVGLNEVLGNEKEEHAGLKEKLKKQKKK